ncbi:septum formation protein [Keratinibaculum paraultunense]|uniref:dTTP/UTP pyrophosphatase n=1 Tax=Keratinibaculum paraultunense TaxID=1278232 RepID=A0A4R3L360_9FIRM|nr:MULTISPECIES: Maf family protein [Bacillota]MBU5455445.1 septum formation protein Maf [Caproiciproducens sp. MSJ-32]QQY80417.1 septum formation protein Maf [Keratinibaculum paraultunense]TCS91133.1 septum formation protein [Keratinibaculum paraultunense]
MNTIVLASSSPRRRKLLEKYNVKPVVVKSNIHEKINSNETIEQIAMALAFEKANQLEDRFSNGEIIIGADTIVACNDKILGKPKDEYDAFNMLKFLSDKEHLVLTGICIIKANSNIKVIDYEKTIVKFRKLSDKKIQKYIETKEYIDKAGAYGIQGLGGVLVEWIKGCYFNVVGLPIYKLDILLERHFDISLL